MYWIVNKSELGVFGAFDAKDQAEECINFYKKRGCADNEKSTYYGIHFIETPNDANIFDWLKID